VCPVSRVMTERIAYERQLELLKRAFSASNQGLLILEVNGGDALRVAYASDRVAALAESTPAKLTGMTLQDVLGALKLPPIAQSIRSQTESVCVVQSGHGGEVPRWLEVRSCRFDGAAAHKDEPGRVVVTF